MTLPEELKELLKQFHELGEYLSCFVAAKTDSVRLSLRNLVLSVVLAAFAFIAIAGLIVIASWLILSGIADGLGGLFGDRSWVGSFITGSLLLAGLWGAMCYTAAKRNKIARRRMAQRYERRQARQHPQFTPDVADQTITTRGERGVLIDQAAGSKTATIVALHDMKNTLMRVADVRSCAKQHPWLVVVGAVAAGVVTGAVLPLTPRTTIKRPRSSTKPESQPIRHGQETPRTNKSRSFSIVVTVLTGILQTAVKSWIAAAFVTQNQAQVETQLPLDSTDTGVPPRRLFRFRSCSRDARN